MERSTIFKNGKPSISMGHLYHGYVSHTQRVYHIISKNGNNGDGTLTLGFWGISQHSQTNPTEAWNCIVRGEDGRSFWGTTPTSKKRPFGWMFSQATLSWIAPPGKSAMGVQLHIDSLIGKNPQDILQSHLGKTQRVLIWKIILWYWYPT